MEPNMKHELVSVFEVEVTRLLADVAFQPLLFFSEKTLQFRLAARLLQLPAFSMPIQTSVCTYNKAALGRVAKSQGVRANGVTSSYASCFSVPPLQMEYGNADLPNARIDLAVLDPIDVPRIANAEGFQDDQGRYLSPLIGAEFFTEKSGSTEAAIQRHLSNDAAKALKCKHGYVINVFRNHRMTSRGTPRSDATEGKLERFRRQLASHKVQHDSVVWIGMIVHLSFADIEFFTSAGEWVRFDLIDGRQAVEARLASLVPTHKGPELNVTAESSQPDTEPTSPTLCPSSDANSRKDGAPC
jgi:hypothetical protein